jgi:1-acyl-sn-glycerol-3-phosphate acyltransferase
MYETIVLLDLLEHPIIVLKAELARLPMWGWLARCYGMIPVERHGSTGAMRAMLRSAQKARESGRSVVIFPEGTRVLPGEMPALRPGFAGLYKALGLPTVPLALDSGRLMPKGRFVRHSGTIHFRYGEPIPAGLPRAEAEARVHAAINRDPAA